MANLRHVEIIKQGVEAIKKWHEQYPDIDLDLSETDLSKVQLNGAILQGADFSGADLSQANLIGADLSDATFDNAQMSMANLTRANLFEATLSEAKLCNAFLGHTDLSNTDLTGADLRRVDLNNADLEKADLSNADMSDANLTRTILYNACLNQAKLPGAILAKANLYNVDLIGTNFDNVESSFNQLNNLDLSRAINLESITHLGPSSIGVDTLVRSGGKISEVFLRGCGLPDNFIGYDKNSTNFYYSCFIIYSDHDSVFAHRVYDALQSRGIRCWLGNHRSIDNSYSGYQHVDYEVTAGNKILICASSSSLTSVWFDDELENAFTKEKHFKEVGHGDVIALISLNLDGYLNSDWKHPKCNAVLERLVADFTHWEKANSVFEDQIEKVVKSLQIHNS